MLEAAGAGRLDEGFEPCRRELEADGTGEEWLRARIVEAMERSDLGFAGNLAHLLAAVRWGSRWYPARPGADARDRPPPPHLRLSLPKLRHDLAQFRHLRAAGRLDGVDGIDRVVAGFRATVDRHAGLGDNARAPLDAIDEQRVGRAYGRIIHLGEAPRLPAALSPAWDPAAVERTYRNQAPGVVVVDDFLTPGALEGLRRFCLESTVWSGNRYAHGRLGAFFFSGFNCPLLLQIAEEVRAAFPNLIGDRHPLRQLWAFKNTGELPADSSVHADFAAVNVNFWITPDDANRDRGSGGMVVYALDAPQSWDFAMYNEREDLIHDLLRRHDPVVVRVPYRQNRAVIFNSDLFHGTEAVRFRPDYASHRINVTMLYGDRADDQHHSLPPAHATRAPGGGSWRSAAFARSRRRP